MPPRTHSKVRVLLRVLLRIALINLALVFLGLAAVELTFGSWLSRDPLAHAYLRRDIEWRYDVRGLYHSASGVAIYRRDHWGLRGGFGAPSAIDVLTVGGSTTDQAFLGEGDTWQDALSRCLKARGRPLSIANAGLDGQSTVGHLTNFERWFPHVPGLRPRYVIVYAGINDQTLTPSDNDETYFNQLDLSKRDWGLRVREQSALYRLTRTVAGALRSRARGISHDRVDFAAETWTTRGLLAQIPTPYMSAQSEAYRRRLSRLATNITQWGALPIFATQPKRSYRLSSHGVEGVARRWQNQGAEFFNGVDDAKINAHFNGVTLDVCRASGSICLDLAGELSAVFTDDDFYDFFHYTPSGAAKIGEYLCKKMDNLAPRR